MSVRDVLSIGHPALRAPAAAVPPAEIAGERVQGIIDGVLITDRADPSTLCTSEEFERHHRDAFIERITRFVERVGS